MGLFDKLKRNQKTPQSAIEPQPNTGVILLFDRPDIEHKEFEIAIAQNYGEHTILQIDTNSPSCIHLMLHIDGMDVVCSYMPFALPPEEADFPTLFGMNYCISDEERKALAEQKSFCILTELGGGSTLAGKRAVCIMLTKLCGCLLRMEGALGVYYNAANLLIGRTVYQKYAAVAEQEGADSDGFPTILWILVYQTHSEDGTHTIETCGLEQFGFLELVFYKPTEEWSQSFEKLYMMSTLQITEKELYKNRDTICFTKDNLSIFKANGKKLAVIGGI